MVPVESERAELVVSVREEQGEPGAPARAVLVPVEPAVSVRAALAESVAVIRP